MEQAAEPAAIAAKGVGRLTEVTVPHGAQVTGDHRGWTAKLTLKGEAAHVEKQVFSREEVITRLEQVEHETTISEAVKREQLSVQVDGQGTVNLPDQQLR